MLELLTSGSNKSIVLRIRCDYPMWQCYSYANVAFLMLSYKGFSMSSSSAIIMLIPLVQCFLKMFLKIEEQMKEFFLIVKPYIFIVRGP